MLLCSVVVEASDPWLDGCLVIGCPMHVCTPQVQSHEWSNGGYCVLPILVWREKYMIIHYIKIRCLASLSYRGRWIWCLASLSYRGEMDLGLGNIKLSMCNVLICQDSDDLNGLGYHQSAYNLARWWHILLKY